MPLRRAASLAAALGLAAAFIPAEAGAHRWRSGGVSFGVTVGPPAPYHYAPRPYGYWGPPAYLPPPVVYAPPVVVVPPPPIIYAPPPVAYAPPPGPTWIAPPTGYAPPRGPGYIPPAQPLGAADGGLKKKW